jgi:hypothetical protein
MARIPNNAARLIVLVDGENFPATHAEALFEQIEERGVIVETRVYGHFDHQTMSGWKEAIKKYGLTSVDVAVKGPNSADFWLTIEAIEIVHARAPDALCIVSSDRGFSALVKRLRASVVRVYGFGEKKAKAEYREHFDFDQFVEIGSVRKSAGPSRAAPAVPKESSQRKVAADGAKSGRPSLPSRTPAAPAKIPQGTPARKGARGRRASGRAPTTAHPSIPVAKILKAVDASATADGWSHQGTVGDRLGKAMPGFSLQDYGYKTMSQLVAAIPELESEKRAGKNTFIRRKAPARA